MNYVIFIENSKLGRRHFNGALKVYNRWAWPYYGPVELKVGHATVFIPCDTVRVQYLGRDQEYRHRAFGIGSLSDYDFLGAMKKIQSPLIRVPWSRPFWDQTFRFLECHFNAHKNTEYKLEPSDLWNDWWFHPAMIINYFLWFLVILILLHI